MENCQQTMLSMFKDMVLVSTGVTPLLSDDPSCFDSIDMLVCP